LTQIKICGITNVEDACCAASAGVQFLGFVFYPPSKRYVGLDRAAAIVGAVRRDFGLRAPRFVGVFVDESEAQVRAAFQCARLDLVQLHGSESPAEVGRLSPFAFKAIRPRTLGLAQAVAPPYCQAASVGPGGPQLLVDAYHPELPGGTGLRANLTVARWLARRYRLLLAGGLTPDTVAEAISYVQPWGVDVSSGVERCDGPQRVAGRKDHKRIRAFAQAVQVADAIRSSIGPEEQR
jgi:phosphoribosylanthranilate isomerase